MGQTFNKQLTIFNHPSDRNHKSQQQITYYITVNDQTFGPVQIYASNKKPLCYLVKIECQQKNSSIFQIFTKIENLQSKFLVNLFALQIKRTQFINFVSQKILAYWQYYNFYLIDYLKARQIKKIALNQSQIWHIIQGCVHCCQIFQYFGLQYELDINKSIVTPQGKIKFYWHHLRQDDSHLAYYKRVRQLKQDTKQQQKHFSRNNLNSQKSNTQGLYLSPEEILLINNTQFYDKVNFKKCNSYRLGMIIIFCVTLNNPALICYNFNQSKIHKSVLHSILQNKIIDAEIYSKQLVQLVQLLLQEDPQKRISIDFIRNMYRNRLQGEYQLQVSGKQSQNKHYTISSQHQSPSIGKQKSANQNIKKNEQLMNNSRSKINESLVNQQDDFEDRRTIKIKYNQINSLSMQNKNNLSEKQSERFQLKQ